MKPSGFFYAFRNLRKKALQKMRILYLILKINFEAYEKCKMSVP